MNLTTALSKAKRLAKELTVTMIVFRDSNGDYEYMDSTGFGILLASNHGVTKEYTITPSGRAIKAG